MCFRVALGQKTQNSWVHVNVIFHQQVHQEKKYGEVPQKYPILINHKVS